MGKPTLEDFLLDRREDPRALRGAITFAGGKPQIVFGVVGDHKRFSLSVNGDVIELVDDPRDGAKAEKTPPVEPKPAKRGKPKPDAVEPPVGDPDADGGDGQAVAGDGDIGGDLPVNKDSNSKN